MAELMLETGHTLLVLSLGGPSTIYKSLVVRDDSSAEWLPPHTPI